jgi:hypothetical protein
VTIDILYIGEEKMNTINKILTLGIIGCFILSGITAAAVANTKDEKIVENISIPLSNPSFEQKGEYLSLHLEESTSDLMEPGKPLLPIISKVLTFPVGTKISNVNVNIDVTEKMISNEIRAPPL